MRIIPRLVLVLAAAFSATAQPTYEKVLLPVFFSGPGAYGSQWGTTVSIANTGESAVRFSSAVLEGNPNCAAVCGCGPSDTIDPQNMKQVCILNADPSGLLLYMDRKLNAVHFGARIVDFSRSEETAGTELKIVRQHELRSGRIVLSNIPIGPGYRVGLRLFDTFPFGSADFHLRIYDHPFVGGPPLLEETIPLTLPPDTGQPRPAHPAFAMIGDLAARYPQLKDHELVTIELLLPEPEDISPPRAPACWAVASITNNVTQQVTMVTPQ